MSGRRACGKGEGRGRRYSAHFPPPRKEEAKKQNRWSLPVRGGRHKIKEDKWEGEESGPGRVGEMGGGRGE